MQLNLLYSSPLFLPFFLLTVCILGFIPVQLSWLGNTKLLKYVVGFFVVAFFFFFLHEIIYIKHQILKV